MYSALIRAVIIMGGGTIHPRGVRCTKHVQVYVSAQEGY